MRSNLDQSLSNLVLIILMSFEAMMMKMTFLGVTVDLDKCRLD